ncbi:MAG TPA: GNAT family N-acetyltransferase [Vicinamibacteria bacterium]|nr:GNAT family N-acetyltransferase [Vicinamibacteria bacterium]
MTVEIVRRREGHAEEVFRLYGEVFGQALTEKSRERWRWQYLQNPSTPPDGPAIWVAVEGGAVLGQYASMPVRLHWGGEELDSSWGMDVFLRPEARGKGIGARLFDAWSDSVPVALGLGLTDSSYGLFKKLRYEDVGPVPFFQKVLDPTAVIVRKAGRLLGAAFGPLAGVALAFAVKERPHPEAAQVAVSPIDGFSDEFDALWDRARGSYAMCVRRDRAYLTWKYRQPPHRRYALHEARRGGALVGYAVSRHEEHAGIRLGWLVDVFADADDHAARDALLGAVLSGFRDAGVARAQAFSMNRALAEDLRRRGFFESRSPMQFCVRAKGDAAQVFAAKERWHVVFGDSDMDR